MFLLCFALAFFPTFPKTQSVISGKSSHSDDTTLPQARGSCHHQTRRSPQDTVSVSGSSGVHHHCSFHDVDRGDCPHKSLTGLMSRVTRSRTHFVMCSYPTNHVQVVEMRGGCPGTSPVSSRAGSGAAQSWYRMSCHHHYRCFVYDFLMDLHPRFWKHIPVHEYWSQDSCSSSLVQLQDVSWTLESVLRSVDMKVKNQSKLR